MAATDRISRKGFLLALAPTAACVGLPDPGTTHGWLTDFVDRFYRQKDVRGAFEAHVAEDYVQHSEGMADGREAAIAILAPMFNRAGFQIDPVRTVVDGDTAIVFLHVTVRAEVHALVIDIFRFENERIVEHWDIKREIPSSQAEHFFARL